MNESAADSPQSGVPAELSEQSIHQYWSSIHRITRWVVDISMTYKTRGGIEYITFDQLGSAIIEEGSELGEAFSSAVDSALERAPYPGVRATTGWIKSLNLPLASYVGKSFEIAGLSDHVASVTMPVEGYDDRDADLEFKRRISHCMDLLALETGNPFWEVRRTFEESPDPSAPKDVFVENPNWKEYPPLANGHLVISPEGKEFVEFIAEDNVGSLERATLLQALPFIMRLRSLKLNSGSMAK